ncbi:MAG: hypothetical protein IPL74_17805 [Bacteroidetes bacterium]|nr:hypothetical protein [Bacteroidota bacterium]
MTLYILLLIMILSAFLGSTVNFFMPSNTDPATGKFKDKWIKCFVLGLGATFLVPLFLQTVDSRLMDNIQTGCQFQDSTCKIKNNKDTVFVQLNIKTIVPKTKSDTNSNTAADSLVSNVNNLQRLITEKEGCPPLKNYLIFAAYCLLAASAGYKFIETIISKVITKEEVKKLTEENKKLDDALSKREKNGQLEQSENKNTLRALVPSIILPPVTNRFDQQKGRFGGMNIRNGRKLSAEVKEGSLPGYFDVTLILESTDSNNPLSSEVIFYLHESFTPDFHVYPPSKFEEGKAIDRFKSYGAFTVGVVADNGQTMLELDLSEQKQFPKEFRER